MTLSHIRLWTHIEEEVLPFPGTFVERPEVSSSSSSNKNPDRLRRQRIEVSTRSFGHASRRRKIAWRGECQQGTPRIARNIRTRVHGIALLGATVQGHPTTLDVQSRIIKRR